MTDQRVLIVCDFPTRSEVSLSLRQLPQTSFVGHDDSGGVITFGESNHFGDWTGKPKWASGNKNTPPQFVLSTDARKVYELIRLTQHNALHRRGTDVSQAA